MFRMLTNFIGKLKSKFSKRSFVGAGSSRFTSDWITMNQTADKEIRSSIVTLRNRARDLVNNNDYASKYVKLCEQNIVGSDGFVLQSKAQDSDGAFDVVANKIIESAYYDWSTTCASVNGRYTFRQLQLLGIRHLVTDGECFFRIIKNKNQNKYGFALQIIEPDLVDERKNEKLKNGNYVNMGVEINSVRKPVAYYIKTVDVLNGSNIKTLRYPAEQIIHIFNPYRADQTRGVSWFSQSMLRLRMLSGYEEAALINARASAAKMGFFKSSYGAEYAGNTVDNNGNIITNAEPGSFEMLPIGVDFVPYDPKYPSDMHDSYVKSILRAIASGLGVSYNTLANDLEGVNYSSIRAGLIDERENWKQLQALFIEQFLEPIYEQWLDMAFLTGNMQFLPYSKIDKFKQHVWIGRRWAWVDPSRDIEAAKIAIENNLKTRQQIIAEQGGDIYEIFEQLKLEKELLKKYNLDKSGEE